MLRRRGELSAIRAGIGAVALAISAITWLVAGGRAFAFDRAVTELLRPLGPLAAQAEWLAVAGSGDVAIALATGLAGALALHHRWRLAILVVATVASAALANVLLKDLVDRPRPDQLSALVQEDGFSFPSGHATLSAALYGTCGALVRRSPLRRSLKYLVMTVLAFLTVLVGISRLVLGVHFASDVLAGWILGFGFALLFDVVAPSPFADRSRQGDGRPGLA